MKWDYEDLEQYGITRQGRFSTAVFSETPATEQMAQARALQYAGHGRGTSVRDALAAVVSELPRQKKTIEELGGSINLTEQEMFEIDRHSTPAQ